MQHDFAIAVVIEMDTQALVQKSLDLGWLERASDADAAKELFALLDKDGSGKVSKKEMQKALRSNKKAIELAKLKGKVILIDFWGVW